MTVSFNLERYKANQINRPRKGGLHVDAYKTVLLCGLLWELTGRGKEDSQRDTKPEKSYWTVLLFRFLFLHISTKKEHLQVIKCWSRIEKLNGTFDWTWMLYFFSNFQKVRETLSRCWLVLDHNATLWVAAWASMAGWEIVVPVELGEPHFGHVELIKCDYWTSPAFQTSSFRWNLQLWFTGSIRTWPNFSKNRFTWAHLKP